MPGLTVCAVETSSSHRCTTQAPQQTRFSAAAPSPSVQPATRKSVESREEREQSELPSALLWQQHTEGRARLHPCRGRHPQSPHCALTLRGWCCTRAGCSSARGHRAFGQLGQEAASFPFKQRLIRQRQVFETCFECRHAKVSHKYVVLLAGVGCLRIRLQGTRRKCQCKGGEQHEAEALEVGSSPI